MLSSCKFLLKSVFFSSYLLIVLLAPTSGSVHAEVVSTTQFERGVREYPWTYFRNVKITDLANHNAGKGMGLAFFFEGGDVTDDSYAEARFILDKAYSHLIISFNLYIPSNYFHRSSKPDNNKLFRLWSNEYKDREKIGSSLRSSSGGSYIGTDYRLKPKWGMSTTNKTRTGFISDADKAKWMAVKLDVVAPSDSSKGSIAIYKNGELFLKDDAVPNIVPGRQGYQKGYLLGWANSGFSTDTYILIDNVTFSDGDSALSPPSPPMLEINK